MAQYINDINDSIRRPRWRRCGLEPKRSPRVLTKTGQFDQAMTVLNPLTSKLSYDWRPWFWTETALLLNKDCSNAALFLDNAIARQGAEVAIWIQRAIVE